MNHSGNHSGDPDATRESSRARERTLFEAALEVEPEQRAGRVRALAEGDRGLEQRVLALVAAHERAQAAPATVPGRRWRLADPERIGPYRVLERSARAAWGSSTGPSSSSRCSARSR